MNKISCFLPYAGKEQVEKNSKQPTGDRTYRRNPVNTRTDTTLESLPGLRNIVCRHALQQCNPQSYC